MIIFIKKVQKQLCFTQTIVFPYCKKYREMPGEAIRRQFSRAHNKINKISSMCKANKQKRHIIENKSHV